MNLACQKCKGACCESMVLDLRKHMTTDVLKWYQYHGDLTAQGVRLHTPCSKLKDGKCGIYEGRPEMCKRFPIGSPSCIASIKAMRNEQDGDEIIQLIHNSQTARTGKELL